MPDKFLPGKKYFFSVEELTEVEPDSKMWLWPEFCEGKQVEVLSPTIGYAGTYRVRPWWCQEVEEVSIDEQTKK